MFWTIFSSLKKNYKYSQDYFPECDLLDNRFEDKLMTHSIAMAQPKSTFNCLCDLDAFDEQLFIYLLLDIIFNPSLYNYGVSYLHWDLFEQYALHVKWIIWRIHRSNEIDEITNKFRQLAPVNQQLDPHFFCSHPLHG